MNQTKRPEPLVLITNRQAEEKLCPLLSTMHADGSVTRVTCMHEACALWSAVLPSGSDAKGNGLGKCDLRKRYAQIDERKSK